MLKNTVFKQINHFESTGIILKHSPQRFCQEKKSSHLGSEKKKTLKTTMKIFEHHYQLLRHNQVNFFAGIQFC